MKKVAVALLIAIMALVIFGCSRHVHTIGKGPAGSDVQTARQWYILFGLVPLNEVDTNAMAGAVGDYEIQTEISALDFLITMFTSMVTVNCRTVTVTK
jgi:hypothetical protein